LQYIAELVDAGDDPAASLLQSQASKTEGWGDIRWNQLENELEKEKEGSNSWKKRSGSSKRRPLEQLEKENAQLRKLNAALLEKSSARHELNAEQEKVTQAMHVRSSSATVIGHATGMIDGSKASCRETKCAYGSLLTDELLRYGKTVNSKTQIALYNGGGIRASIPKGAVTDEHLKAVHPYGNHIILAQVSGSAIKTMVEVALNEHGPPLTGAAGNWLQRSGMRFTSSWDSTSSSWTTPEVEVAKGGDDSWELLDLDREYNIVTNQYIMDGNGGRNVIKNAAKGVNDTMRSVLSLMTEYFQHSSPVAPPTIRMHY
jgi:5'-nucleotidase